ncbi:hypothetical protein, partial [Streptosporangium lutulentum]
QPMIQADPAPVAETDAAPVTDAAPIADAAPVTDTAPVVEVVVPVGSAPSDELAVASDSVEEETVASITPAADVTAEGTEAVAAG